MLRLTQIQIIASADYTGNFSIHFVSLLTTPMRKKK